MVALAKGSARTGLAFATPDTGVSRDSLPPLYPWLHSLFAFCHPARPDFNVFFNDIHFRPDVQFYRMHRRL